MLYVPVLIMILFYWYFIYICNARDKISKVRYFKMFVRLFVSFPFKKENIYTCI